MSLKQISVFLENRPGALCEMTNVLAENNVDMRAFSLAEASDFGIARIIVDNVYNASTVLRDAHYVHTITPVLAVVLPDTPGGLNRILNVLQEAAINVEYMYAFLGNTPGSAYMVFKVADPEKATAALRAQDIRMLEEMSV